MTLTTVIASAMMAATASTASAATCQPPIIPLPVSYEATGDSIAPISPASTLVGADTGAASMARDAFNEFFVGRPAREGAKPTTITFTLSDTDQPGNNVAESYSLSIAPGRIDICAPDSSGLFYGVMTLRALAEASPSGKLPVARIDDAPRFPYRGLMLDVSRNFRNTDFVLKQLDAMARLKLNRFHFHITDGAGWRLQLDGHPRLTEYAAWRIGDTWKDWCDNGNRYAEASSPEARGGFYTKDDIRRIIDYAARRNITVIPEIEMPGHSEEVLATYPMLSCSGKAESGENDFCIGNDSTLTFLKSILDEVIELFPSKTIHIGGDEAAKNSWRKCPKCQARIESLGLDGVDGLQSWFIGRIADYLTSRGRSMMGWDEIMEGGLPENAQGNVAVMSWRGTEGGEKAASMGYPVVMTPGAYCYLDGYQDAPYSQPEAIGGYLPLEKAFAYEPVPQSLAGTDKEHLINGVQGNLFTEYVATDSHAEHMLYPRMYAIAERAWSPASDTLYAPFRERALALNERLRSEGYTPFNLAAEIGNRPGSERKIEHLAYGKRVTYNEKPWSKYPANGEMTLTDGIVGGWNYNDNRWQAFLGTKADCLDFTIDLGEPTDIRAVKVEFMQVCGADVWLPEKVEISVSDNGSDFTAVSTKLHERERTATPLFEDFGWTGSPIRARYIRCRASIDPEKGGVLFTDEVIVE